VPDWTGRWRKRYELNSTLRKQNLRQRPVWFLKNAKKSVRAVFSRKRLIAHFAQPPGRWRLVTITGCTPHPGLLKPPSQLQP
jgi:hypothetical protein